MPTKKPKKTYKLEEVLEKVKTAYYFGIEANEMNNGGLPKLLKMLGLDNETKTT